MIKVEESIDAGKLRMKPEVRAIEVNPSCDINSDLLIAEYLTDMWVPILTMPHLVMYTQCSSRQIVHTATHSPLTRLTPCRLH
jgi:hypothetical protein